MKELAGLLGKKDVRTRLDSVESEAELRARFEQAATDELTQAGVQDKSEHSDFDKKLAAGPI